MIRLASAGRAGLHVICDDAISVWAWMLVRECGILYLVHTEGEIAVAGGATGETVLQVTAATNIPIEIVAQGVHPKGATPATEPCTYNLRLQTTAGTGGTSTTPILRDRNYSRASQFTALQGITTAPTGTTVLHPSGEHQQVSDVVNHAAFKE